MEKTSLNDKGFCEIAESYPNLHARVPSPDGVRSFRGKFPIIHEGAEVDRFFIRLDLPLNFPWEWPRVWETGGRIPCTRERHVNPEDQTLCVLLPDEAYLRYPRDMRLIDYLDGPLRNFFIGQLCIENGQPWPWGEHRHGMAGRLDFYCELLAVRDPLVICKMLLLICRRNYKGHWACPCDSGAIIRKCHGPMMKWIGETIPMEQLVPTVRAIVQEIRQVVQQRSAAP